MKRRAMAAEIVESRTGEPPALAGHPWHVARLRVFSRLAGLAVALIAGLSFLEWGTELRLIRRLLPSPVAMNPATSLALILAGVLLVRPRALRGVAEKVGASLIILLGLLKLIDYATPWTLGFDRLLFASRLQGDGGTLPNQIAPNTALALLLVGLGLWARDVRSRSGYWPSQFLALVVFLLGVVALVGYAYGIHAFYGVGRLIPMALTTATAFLLLGLGLLAERPDQGLMAVVTSDSVGGVIARRLLPASVLIPTVLGWLRLQGQRGHYYETEVGAALLVVCIIVIFVALVWWSAGLLHRAETEQRRSDRALRESEVFYHSLVESLPQNIFRKDVEGRFTFANRGFCDDLGRPLDQIIGRTDADFFPAPLAAKYRADDQAVMTSGVPIETVEDHLTADGQRHYVQVIKTALRDPSGTVIGTQGIFWDVTPAKRVEEELRRSRERFELAVEGSSDGIWDWDIGTGQVYFSARWKGQLGYDDDELGGQLEEWESRLHPDDRQRVLATVRAYLDGQVPEYVVEHRLRHKDGSYRWILTRGVALRDAAGRAYRMAGSHTDVTERRAAEDALAERARLAALSADVGLALSRGNTLRGILQPGAEALVRHLDAAFARVWILDEAEAALVLQASAGQYTHRDGPHGRIAVGQFEIGRIAEERKPHLSNAVASDPRLSDPEWARREGMVAFAGHPLVFEDRLVGVMAVFARHSLSQATLDTLAAVADGIALGVERICAEEALRQANALAQLMQSVAVAANEAETLDETLLLCLDRVCAYTGWPVGHVYLPAGDGSGDLEPTTLWHLDSPERFEAFRRITEATRLASGSGLPGRVYQSGEPAWIMDVTEDANFPRSRAGADLGIRAGFAFPVKVGADVTAVLEFFATESREPDPALLEIVAFIGTQLARVSERQMVEARLHRQNQLLEEAVHSERRTHFELKQTQSRMVESAKLAGLGQMVAGVAHEINNPLSFVSNNVAVLQRDLAELTELLGLYGQADDLLAADRPALHERIQGFRREIDLDYTLSNLDGLLARTRDGLRRIQQIVKDLRVFARIDESELNEADLNAGVESTATIILGHAKKKQVRVDLELAPLPPVACYPAKINQVIMNLVSNAIDACEEGGRVTIRTRPEDGGVRIEIEDDGCGIDPAICERIFDPFFTTKPIGVGTGLGLSISYGIVQDHGGRIELDTAPGRGSRFTIHLPTRLARRQVAADLASTPSEALS